MLFVDAPKVDMIILLLLVQTENNKLPPSENDGNIFIAFNNSLVYECSTARVAGRCFRVNGENQTFSST